MFGKRTIINIIVFLGATFLLVFLAATQLVLPKTGGRTVNFEFTDAVGVQPRNDVTLRGVPAGAVKDVQLLPNGLVRVTVIMEPGFTVPRDSIAEINRRSPIGDLTLNIIPSNKPPLPDGGTIGPKYTIVPPDAEKTIEILAQILHAVPSKKLTTLIEELATAVRGRGRDLASLSVTTADLPERLLQVRSQLESLIVNGPKVTGVLAENAQSFANDITYTAQLADILRDRRYDLVELSKNGANFATVANDLISAEKANLACFVADLGALNTVLGQHLDTLAASLDLNHFFFDAVGRLVKPGVDALDWFRVNLVAATGEGRSYRRPTPDVYAGNACHSIYGNGVGPGTQPGPVWLANGSKLHPGS